MREDRKEMVILSNGKNMRVEVRSGVVPENAPLVDVIESYLRCPMTPDDRYLWVEMDGETYYLFFSSYDVSTDEIVYRCVHKHYQVYFRVIV